MLFPSWSQRLSFDGLIPTWNGKLALLLVGPNTVTLHRLWSIHALHRLHHLESFDELLNVNLRARRADAIALAKLRLPWWRSGLSNHENTWSSLSRPAVPTPGRLCKPNMQDWAPTAVSYRRKAFHGRESVTNAQPVNQYVYPPVAVPT